MSFAIITIKAFLHIGILLGGVLVLLLIGAFKNLLIKRIPLLKTRIRIIYGYTTIVCIICSNIIYWYNHENLFNISKLLPIFSFSNFIFPLFFPLSFTLIICTMKVSVEGIVFDDLNFNPFLSILIILISGFFITLFSSLIYILFMYVVLGFGISLFMFSFEKPEKKEVSEYKNHSKMYIISLLLFFLGIITHYLSLNTFLFERKNSINLTWLGISSVFILTFLFIQIGIPPFHFYYFNLKEQNIAPVEIYIIIQKWVSLFILTKYVLFMRNLFQNIFLLTILLIMSSISLIWGIFSTLTINNLKKLLEYILLYLSGIYLLLLSFTLTSDSYLLTIKSISAFLFLYPILCLFSFSLVHFSKEIIDNPTIKNIATISSKSNLAFILFISMYIFLFSFPILILIIGSFFYIQFVFSFQWIYSSTLITFSIILSLIYVIKHVSMLFEEKKRRIKDEKTLYLLSNEQFSYLAVILSFFAIMLCIIFANNLLTLFEKMIHPF